MKIPTNPPERPMSAYGDVYSIHLACVRIVEKLLQWRSQSYGLSMNCPITVSDFQKELQLQNDRNWAHRRKYGQLSEEELIRRAEELELSRYNDQFPPMVWDHRYYGAEQFWHLQPDWRTERGWEVSKSYFISFHRI